MFLLIGLAIIYYASYRLYQHFCPTPNINPNGKYVLISGCDSGFGHGLALELDQQGFNVLAGVYLPDNVTVLKNKLSPKATVFRLDITKQEDIDAAFELVKKETKVLHALVNNAGIGTGGYIDWITMESIRTIMDVNFFGHVAMTKKFLPLLIAKRDSRVVNICSVMGFITPPGMSAYCASKYAFESFSDCLRREMAPWSLRVSIIEPGWLRTPIIDGHERLIRDLWNRLALNIRKRWGEDFFNDLIEKTVTKNICINNAEDPIKVVRALQHAVMNSKPRIRYRPDLQAKFFFHPVSLLPACFRLYQHFFPSSNINPNGKYVLISGCDTGFGNGLALELDQQGFNVLAGVYLPDNIVKLKNKLSSKSTVFRLDITKQEDIESAYDLVENKTNTLHALINNAGIAGGTLIDWTSMEVMRKVMDVNFFGHVAMTKKFLPLLITKRDSRVVNMSSMLGFISLPGTSAYSSSKYALESFSDCLRREMAPWGLRVSIIEPGTMRTPIIEGIGDNIRNSWNQLSTDIQERWGDNFLNNTILQSINNSVMINAENPIKVIRAVQHAVINSKPKIRYRAGWQSKMLFLISSICPAKVMDKLQNIGESFTPAGIRNQLMD